MRIILQQLAFGLALGQLAQYSKPVIRAPRITGLPIITAG